MRAVTVKVSILCALRAARYGGEEVICSVSFKRKRRLGAVEVPVIDVVDFLPCKREGDV